MVSSVLKKAGLLFSIVVSFSGFASEKSNVTIKLPAGAAFVSYVSFATDGVDASDYTTLAVGKSLVQRLNVGDFMLVDTLTGSLGDKHRCDYFILADHGDVTVEYTGVAWAPKFKIDRSNLKLVHRYNTEWWGQCDDPDVIRDNYYYEN